MISLSHWGMFGQEPRPFLVPKGFKIAPKDMAALSNPDNFIEMIPLEKGEPQPIYYVGGETV